MGNKYYNKAHFSLLQQKVALATYKDSKSKIEGGVLFWHGKIKPTPLSKEYYVLVSYKLWDSPKVWVIGEELGQIENKNLPHKYEVSVENKMVRICLYRYSEFNAYKLIANTIIPWTVEWLYYYELWQATGEWLGGGEHPENEIDKTD